jgi:hypothetical protein
LQRLAVSGQRLHANPTGVVVELLEIYADDDAHLNSLHAVSTIGMRAVRTDIRRRGSDIPETHRTSAAAEVRGLP